MVGIMLHIIGRSLIDGTLSNQEQEPEGEYGFKNVSIHIFIRKNTVLTNNDIKRAVDRHVLSTYKKSRRYQNDYWKWINKLWERRQLKRKYFVLKDEQQVYDMQYRCEEHYIPSFLVKSLKEDDIDDPMIGVIWGPAPKDLMFKLHEDLMIQDN